MRKAGRVTKRCLRCLVQTARCVFVAQTRAQSAPPCTPAANGTGSGVADRFDEKESGAGLPHHPVVKLDTVDDLEVMGVFSHLD